MIRILCADITSADTCIYGEVYRRLYDKSSEERRKRADRYLRFEDKLRCVVADALLQKAVGTDHVRIEKNEFGKPRIKDHENFHYNISHSGRYVVIAWGETNVGVDVQQHCIGTNRMAVAEMYFASDEQAYVGQNLRRFYEVWTGKESYLKYTGEGLRKNMRSFSILDENLHIRYVDRLPDGEYSLSLCTLDEEYTFELLDARQL
jgi:4'-phosphopantetheinyl transferase